MLNLFSFFKHQASQFRQDNRHRSADYLAGGADALREAGDTLTAQKDVVDLERVSNQLRAQEKEARELRTANKNLDELRRTFQSRCDLQAKEIEKLKSRLANSNKGAITAEVQSRADKQSGHWQSIALHLRNTFFETALALNKQGQAPDKKANEAAKILAGVLAKSNSRKHRILGDWLLSTEAPTAALPIDKNTPNP